MNRRQQALALFVVAGLMFLSQLFNCAGCSGVRDEPYPLYPTRTPTDPP